MKTSNSLESSDHDSIRLHFGIVNNYRITTEGIYADEIFFEKSILRSK